MKKIIPLLILIGIVSFSCTTVNTENYTTPETTKKIVEKSKEIPEIEPEDELKVLEALTNNILASSDPYIADFATIVLDLIRNKRWEFISEITDISFYKEYVIENNGSFVDYAMYMFHTGAVGPTTNRSLNQISNAFFTSSFKENNIFYYEGLYIFPDGEKEYFKLAIVETDIGLIITRE